jgi:hypothetical protein
MSITTIAIIVVALIALIVLIFVAKMIAKGGKVTEYFENAVKVYLWLDDISAGVAALTAAKTAAAAQRDAMIAHLMQLSGQFAQLIDKIPELQVFKARLEKLSQEIGVKDWTIQDIREAKTELGEVSPKYLEALNRSDPSVFVSRYPDLFRASNILELVQAAEGVKRSEVERGVEVMEKLKDLKEFQDPKVKAILDQGIEQAKKDLDR